MSRRPHSFPPRIGDLQKKRARRAELAQEVDEIIGEAVVVIDQDEHAADNHKK